MNGLELTQSALTEWRKNRGEQSLRNYCQWFNGWYVQWAFEGFTAAAEKSIAVYSSAYDAYRASTIYSKKVNDKAIKPGHQLFWDYTDGKGNRYGHVATAIGWDGDRLLVSHTGSHSDIVQELTNGVRIAHADTMQLPYLGASKTDGKNKERTGITAYTPAAPAEPTEKQRVVKNPVGEGYINGRSQPSTKSGEVKQRLEAGVVGNFDGYIKGEKVTVQGTTSDIWFRGAYGGNFFSAAGFTSQATKGLKSLGAYKEPAAAKKRYVHLDTVWYYYLNEADAKVGRNYTSARQLPAGDYEIIDQKNDKVSPFQVRSAYGNVWVGTSYASPQVITK